MAAVTVTNLQSTVEGNKNVWFATVASVDDGDTWVTPLQAVESVLFTPTTAVAWGATISGSTITFKVASGTLAGIVRVSGV